MEDTLGDNKTMLQYNGKPVLILVLMEDTLGEKKQCNILICSYGLNPCSNGRYSRRCMKKMYLLNAFSS